MTYHLPECARCHEKDLPVAIKVIFAGSDNKVLCPKCLLDNILLDAATKIGKGYGFSILQNVTGKG